MRRPRIVAVALFSVALVASPVLAGELAGVSMADRIEVAGHALLRNGMGLREATWLKVDVYVAGLYLESTSSDPQVILAPDRIKHLVMEFVRSVGRAKLVEAWNEGFAKAAGDDGALRESVDRFNGWMTDVKKGDSLAFTYIPGEGTAVDVKGSRAGTIPGDAFARALFAIWLGPSPPNPGIREGLLGMR